MSLSDRDIFSLKQGWKRGFGDDDAFVDYFFAEYDSEDTRIVRRIEAEEIIAQMHYFIFDDESCGDRGCYIYGVTTLPEYRGHGVAQGMIEECMELLRSRGVAYAVLIAENDTLCKWYAKMGFVQLWHEIAVTGVRDGMNFAMEDRSLNRGMYYMMKPGLKNFASSIRIGC